MTTVIITNPSSRFNRRHTGARQILSRRGDVQHIETAELDDLEGAISNLDGERLQMLGINGGDGTVHHVMTALLSHLDVAAAPPIALFPGGTTNMTATDINGGRTTFRSAMQIFDAWVTGRALTKRHILRVRVEGAPTRYGFFFGMGAIVQGIDFRHHHLTRRGAEAHWWEALAVARALFGFVRRDPGYRHAIGIAVEHAGELITPEVSIMLVSTLNRLIFGITPWGGASGVLRTAFVDAHARRHFKALAHLLGRSRNRVSSPEAGYFSCAPSAIRVTAPERYTLDGEIYESG